MIDTYQSIFVVHGVGLTSPGFGAAVALRASAACYLSWEAVRVAHDGFSARRLSIARRDGGGDTAARISWIVRTVLST